jgi:adenine-specific DNA-methyltransferase
MAGVWMATPVERAMMPVDSPLRAARTNRASAVENEPQTTTATLELLGGLPAWWEARATAAGLTGQWLDVEWAVSAEVPYAVRDAVESTRLAGLSAYEIGEAYTATLYPRDRARHGRHYTPEWLASELWEMTKRALGWKRPHALPGLVRDPACGAGALLLPPLREHLGAAARVDPQLALAGLPNYFAGTDNDENAVWLANVLLASEMLPVLSRAERARRRPLPALVKHGDGLAESEQLSLATLMNPPYGRVKLTEAERTRFAQSLYGHANLYGLFMAAGVEALEDSGVLSALVPTSFLAGRYFENLRAVLAETAPVREISFVGNRGRSFAGVLQETCLATFTRRRGRRTVIGRINGHRTEIARVTTPRMVTPWLLPRRSDDAAIASAALAMPLKLGQAGWRVSTGPLVWNRRREDLGALPKSGSAPVLWAADIDGGIVHRDSARDDLRYLALRGSEENFMVLDEPAVLVQRTTAPEQTRRLISALLSQEMLDSWGGRAVIENHINVVRPANNSSNSPVLDVETLARFFATETADRVLRCLTGSVAVSAYELEALPLPSVDVLVEWLNANSDDFSHTVAAAYRPVQP